MLEFNYKLPAYGLGTDFSRYERPITFAQVYQNRFRNITGGAERRPGVQASFGQINGLPNLTRCHELVDEQGNATLLASDDFGNIWKYDGNQNWSQVYSLGQDARLLSVQAEEKLIFVNGVDRNFYTKDGLRFTELKAIITRGKCAAGTNATTLVDGDISNWVGATLVANNDIVYNSTLGVYGIVTAIASAALTHTSIGPAFTGAGNAPRIPAAGDTYELIDYVDLNIIPIGAVDGSDGLGNDNVGIGTSGTAPFVIAVSGVDFSSTEIRVGDFIYNTTRSAIDIVKTVSANINTVYGISGQTSGDSIVFFKSAMPIVS